MTMSLECYRLIKPVAIQPILDILDRLPFFMANVGGSPDDPKRMPCFVVLKSEFPPEIWDLIHGLNLGGELARAVLRKLTPGQNIPPHIDEWMPEEVNWRRFQIPITSHPDIKMRWPDDGIEVHLEPGNLYEVRFDRLHEVVNPTDHERIHLQIDQIDATI